MGIDRLKYIVVLLVCLVSTLNTRAGDVSKLLHQADSLQQLQSDMVLPLLRQCQKMIHQGSAEQRVVLYRLLSAHFSKRELMDSAHKYFQWRLEWATKCQMLHDVIMAKTDLGEYYGKKGDYKKAFQLLSEAREQCQISQSPSAQAKILANQAYLYYLFEKKTESLQLLKEVLGIYTSLQDTMNMSYLNNNIGILYKNQNKYDSALVYLGQSFYQSRQIKDTLGMASACNNMGNVLSLVSNLKGALEQLNKSLFYYRQLGREELSLYSNLGRIHKELGQMDQSLKYFNFALELAYQQDEPKKIMVLLREISDFYRAQQDWRNAFLYMDEYHQFKEREYQKELPELIDRIQAEADLKIKEQTIQLLTEKNNYQSLYLRHKNSVIILLIAFVLVVLGLGFSLYARKQVEHKRRELSMEQRLLRSQMNPHFFFNTLTIIQSFVVRNEAKLAGKYIAKFARLMREILENSARNKITLHRELSAMENYLSLQQLRMNSGFEYRIQVDEAVNPHAIEIPPMLFQPFIENAIDHGLNHLRDRKGELAIQINLLDDMLQVLVRDNGVGRAKAGEINGSLRRNHQSLGSKITDERLNLLSNDKRKRSRLIIRDLMDDQEQALGTEVEVKIVFDRVGQIKTKRQN